MTNVLFAFFFVVYFSLTLCSRWKSLFASHRCFANTDGRGFLGTEELVACCPLRGYSVVAGHVGRDIPALPTILLLRGGDFVPVFRFPICVRFNITGGITSH